MQLKLIVFFGAILAIPVDFRAVLHGLLLSEHYPKQPLETLEKGLVHGHSPLPLKIENVGTIKSPELNHMSMWDPSTETGIVKIAQFTEFKEGTNPNIFALNNLYAYLARKFPSTMETLYMIEPVLEQNVPEFRVFVQSHPGFQKILHSYADSKDIQDLSKESVDTIWNSYPEAVRLAQLAFGGPATYYISRNFPRLWKNVVKAEAEMNHPFPVLEAIQHLAVKNTPEGDPSHTEELVTGNEKADFVKNTQDQSGQSSGQEEGGKDSGHNGPEWEHSNFEHIDDDGTTNSHPDIPEAITVEPVLEEQKSTAEESLNKNDSANTETPAKSQRPWISTSDATAAISGAAMGAIAAEIAS